MANPYQPGPAPMPTAPPPGYGWPAQPGSPAGQTYSPYPTPKPAGSRNVPASIAAGLVLLEFLIDIGRILLVAGSSLTSWTVLGWILMAAATITGGVLTLTNRNSVSARITVALAVGAVFSSQVFALANSLRYSRYGYFGQGEWLAIPGALVGIAAIVLLYIASRADAAKSGAAQPATAQSAHPGWSQQPQAPLGQQPPGGFPGQPAAGFPQQQPPSQPSGFPQQQPPAPHPSGFPQQQPSASQPSGFPQQPPLAPQPSGFPQQQFPGQQPGVPQQPGYQPQGFPGQQHPGFAAPQPAPGQPGQFAPPPGAFGVPPQPPQHPNPPAAPQDSGNQPTVMHQPGSTPDNQQTILQQPGANPPPQPGSPFPQPNASDAGSPSAADPTVYQPPSTPQGPQQ